MNRNGALSLATKSVSHSSSTGTRTNRRRRFGVIRNLPALPLIRMTASASSAVSCAYARPDR